MLEVLLPARGVRSPGWARSLRSRSPFQQRRSVHVRVRWPPASECRATLLIDDPSREGVTDDVTEGRTETNRCPPQQLYARSIGPRRVTEEFPDRPKTSRREFRHYVGVDDESPGPSAREVQLDAMTHGDLDPWRDQVVKMITEVERGALDGDPHDARLRVARALRHRPRHEVPPPGRAAPR